MTELSGAAQARLWRWELARNVQTWYRAGEDRGVSVASRVDVPDGLEGCGEYCGACKSEFARYACWMVNEAIEAIERLRCRSGRWTELRYWMAFDDGVFAGIEDNILRRLRRTLKTSEPFTE